MQYTKGLYGPYSDNLRHALQSLEGHYLVGFGDGSALVREAEPIRPLPGADASAAEFLNDHPATLARIARVLDLVDGFESPYGMELLATVHWVSDRDPEAASDAAAAASAVRAWSRRKERMFTPDHVTAAWAALRNQGWIAVA